MSRIGSPLRWSIGLLAALAAGAAYPRAAGARGLTIKVEPRMLFYLAGGPRVVADVTFTNTGPDDISLQSEEAYSDCVIASDQVEITDVEGRSIAYSGVVRQPPATHFIMLASGKSLLVHGLDLTHHYAFPRARTNLTMTFRVTTWARGKPHSDVASPPAALELFSPVAPPDDEARGDQQRVLRTRRSGNARIVECEPIFRTPYPAWLAGRWKSHGSGAVEASFESDPPIVRGTVTNPTAPARARTIARYVVKREGRNLVATLQLEREGPRPYRFAEAPCPRPPGPEHLCFRQVGVRPGPYFLEISREEGRLITNIGFGPQHGAMVFERLELDRSE